MKRWLIIVVVALMAGWAIYDFVIKDDTEEEVEMVGIGTDEIGLEKGEKAPDFELETLDGETVKLSDFQGQPVLLNFWATWCPPCREEMPDIQKLHENNDVKVLAVDAFETEKSEEGVQEFVDEMGVTFDILLDENSKVITVYNVMSFPTTY